MHKVTTLLVDGRRVRLQLWDTSGQGRFCTILRSYSRGAQGLLLVYDLTNKWSFDGIDRWRREVEEVKAFFMCIALKDHITYVVFLFPAACSWGAKGFSWQPTSS